MEPPQHEATSCQIDVVTSRQVSMLWTAVFHDNNSWNCLLLACSHTHIFIWTLPSSGFSQHPWGRVRGKPVANKFKNNKFHFKMKQKTEWLIGWMLKYLFLNQGFVKYQRLSTQEGLTLMSLIFSFYHSVIHSFFLSDLKPAVLARGVKKLIPLTSVICATIQSISIVILMWLCPLLRFIYLEQH